MISIFCTDAAVRVDFEGFWRHPGGSNGSKHKKPVLVVQLSTERSGVVEAGFAKVVGAAKEEI